MSKLELGKRMRAARKAAKLNVKQVAAKVGREPQTVYRWERDGTEPSLDDLRAYARVCGVSLSELFAV